MPPIVKQTLSVIMLTAIIAPLSVGITIWILGIIFNNSINGAALTKSFTTLVERIVSIDNKVTEISVNTLNNHLIILSTVNKNEKADLAFRAEAKARLKNLEK
jgi:hypothetical protein